MNKQPSNVLVLAVATVAGLSIVSLTLILITLEESALPEGWLGLFLGFLGTLIVAVVSLGKIDKIGRQVDDLSNGLMDSKIRAGVADVLGDHLLDPGVHEQLKTDRARRNSVEE